MKPEQSPGRYQIFQTALDLPPEERSAFLDQVCGGDSRLRAEIQSLILAYEEAGTFIERPAIEVDAVVVAGSLARPVILDSIGHYQILEPLGAGGMGEVYLASDTRTDRKVALKLLPDDLTKNDERVRRFQQEARAALALNHPNIVTIYEIGEADGRFFISSEWIHGETLGQRLRRKALTLSEALDIAIQVASALNEAHQSGIVHRDIKPENIMLRPDGYVKVLDFGIAKLIELPAAASSEAPTALQVKTAPGMVVGTAKYMSPEQTRGLQVDQRTDIWSLGIVLYEMVAGCLPFEGETAGDVIASILEKQPAPLARYSRQAPEALEEIVATALAKNREERYQTATQFMAALRRLKQRLDAAAELERSVHSEGVSSPISSVVTRDGATTNAAVPAQPQTHQPSSAEYIVSEIKRHRRSVAVIFALLTLAIAGGGYGLYRLWNRPKSVATFETMKPTRLTTIGNVSAASMSVDGKYIAYVVDEGYRQSLWVKQLAIATSTAQIVPPTAARYLYVTFSPDGNYIYYGRQEKGPIELYQVPLLGGPARKLMDAVNQPTFSPDGNHFAFLRARKLMIANADGTDERQLAPGPCSSPTWSPDGKVIAYVSEDVARVRTTPLVAVHVADGTEGAILSRQGFVISQVSWLRDSSGLAVVAREGPNQSNQLWYVSYPDGDLKRVSHDLLDYRTVSATSDSETLLAVESEQLSNIWVAPQGDAGRARQITSAAGGKQEGASTISWTPSGKIVYVSLTATGRSSIWIAEADGTGQRQITDGSYNAERPAVSPDGRYVVFESDRAGFGSQNIWRIDIDGTNLKHLTDGGLDILASCSPDGRWVIYSRWVIYNGSGENLWKVPIDGGTPVQLTNAAQARGGIVSPDGKLIVCWYVAQSLAQASLKIGVFPFEGGEPIKTFDLQPTAIPPPGPTPNYLRWTSDSGAVLYIDTKGGVSNIWMQPIDGRAPKQVTDFKSERIFSFDWSKDGKQLTLARGTLISDVVLISNFK